MPQNRDAQKIDFVITSMHQLGPVYKDPDVFKVDPHTQDNLAYGHYCSFFLLLRMTFIFVQTPATSYHYSVYW